MKKVFILVILFFMVIKVVSARVVENNVPVWKILLAEAASEGEVGIKAVFCAMRNRANNEDISIKRAFERYCVASRRKDLNDFVGRQGDYWIEIAKEVAQGNFNDITKGATHFENIEKFSIPYWAESMIITIKINNHTFYKEG